MSIGLGIVGTGGFSRMHATLLTAMPDVDILGICGTSLDKSSAMAADFPFATSYSNLEEMLDTGKIDAVYVCVPPMAHGLIEQTLIDRKIPFFVEKPLGVDTEIPDNIAAALSQTSIINSVGYHFRYQDNVDRLKRELSDCTIGMIAGRWNGNMPGVKWWRDQQSSGGQFNEQTTHIVDLVRYLAGEIKEVSGYFGDRIMKKKEEAVTVSDVGTVNMKLQSGAVVNIMNTCILPDGIGDIGLDFYTDKGIINWKPDHLRICTQAKEIIYKQQNNPYLAENEAFIKAVLSGDSSQIRSDYADAVKTQKVASDALQSARKK